MLGVPLRDRARMTRVVTVTADLAISITEPDYMEAGSESWRPVRLLEPMEPRRPSDGSPREAAPRRKLYCADSIDLVASSRIEVFGEGIFELLSDARPVRNGSRVIGFEVEVMPVEQLYPVEGGVSDEGEIVPVRFALFAPRDDMRERNDFAGYSAQAPIEYESLLTRRNAVIVCGARTFRVVNAQINFQIPQIAMELRER